jgi:heme-degrading monooxygenase HmoA
MAYLRVSIGSWNVDLTSDVGQAAFRQIEEEGLAVFHQQPGFIRYRLMQADSRTTVAVAEWESQELGQAGAKRYREWLRSSGIMAHLSLHTYDGPVVVAS